MPFVIDASITMTWAFTDESTAHSLDVLRRLRHDEALVPGIWAIEVSNALVVGQRRERMTLPQANAFVQLLRNLRIVVDPVTLDRAFGTVSHIARSQALSAYDAAYIELAMREGLVLATEDIRMREAATRLGVPLLT